MEIKFIDEEDYNKTKFFTEKTKNDQVKNECVLISKILDQCEKEIERITGISLE